MALLKLLGTYALAGTLGLALFAAASWFRPALLAWTGRANGCGVAAAQTVHGYDLKLAHLRLQSQTKIEKVPGSELLLHKTPRRGFYAPPKTAVAFVLAEEEVQVYGSGEYRVKPGDVVLDCGANVGTFTDEALRAGAQLVVAIEPSPLNVDGLKRTFAKEIAEGRVIVYPKGVWDKDDVLKMNVFENSALDSFVMNTRAEEQSKPREVELPLTTIDKIVEELKLERVTYIKMDVEGAERKALLGGRATLVKHRPRMSVAMENLPDDYREVPKVIRSIRADYRQACLWCREAGWLEVRPDIVHFY
jgi:FkbM family methyltransferase